MPGLGRNLALTLAEYVVGIFVAAFLSAGIDRMAEVISTAITKKQHLPISFFSEFAFGLILTGMTAWPGFIATVAISRWRGYGSKAFFATCGLANAVLSVLLFSAVGQDLSMAGHL